MERFIPQEWHESFEKVLEKQKTRIPEQAPTREFVIPHFKIMTVSGPSGTGKSKSTEILAWRHGAYVFKIGEIEREIVRVILGKEIIGYVERPDEIDWMVDEFQRELFRHADELDRPIIVEGRMAGINATEVFNEMGIEAPRIARILLVANRRERMRRLAKRENSKLGAGSKPLSQKEIMRETMEREQGDFVQFRKGHPILTSYHGINVDSPFNPSLRDPQTGKHPFYDIVENNSSIDVYQTCEEIIDKEVELGFGERMDHRARFSRQGIVYIAK